MNQIPHIGGDFGLWSVSRPVFYIGVLEPNLPVIIKQPEDVAVNKGQPVRIGVEAIRTKSYNWQGLQPDGSWVDIGFTQSSIYFASADSSMVGTYRCVLTGPDGTKQVTSNVVIVVVN